MLTLSGIVLVVIVVSSNFTQGLNKEMAVVGLLWQAWHTASFQTYE